MFDLHNKFNTLHPVFPIYNELFGLSSTLSFCQQNSTSETEILWDTYGVPHIYATNEYDLHKAYGWAQMKNHGNLILRVYGESRGKSAEYWGENYKRDRMLHLMNLPTTAARTYDNLTAKEKLLIEAFTEGINDYVAANPTKIDDKYKVVLPVKPVDIHAHMLRGVYYEFLADNEFNKSQQWEKGSNAWAIAPKNTKNGNALLLANPHLPWSDNYASYKFFEAHYNLNGKNLYGVTLIGFPIISIAFNDYLGWTHTVNTLDNTDLYELTLKDGKYLLDGKYLDFKVETNILKSKQEDGSLKIDTLIRKISKHGVVVSEKGNKALALRFPYMENPPHVLQQWYDMGQATNFNEFETALKQNAVGLFNVIYADKTGNIFYSFLGNLPDKKGEWKDWRKTVSGDNSDLIWNTYHTYDEFPKLLNPKSGWLQNANEGPYTSTIPQEIDYEAYDKDISVNNMGFRPQQSASLLLNKKDLTIEELITLKHSTKSSLFERIKDDIEGLRAINKDSLTTVALDVFKNWNGEFNADSKGAVLFINLFFSLDSHNLFKEKWSAKKPLTTPDGFNNPETVLATLKGVSKNMIKTLGSLEVPYGAVFRIKLGDHEIPANGSFGRLGVFRTLAFSKGKDGKYYAFHGDGYVCVTEFGDEIKAKVILGYGNASQPGNKHVGDQLELFSKKQLRDAWIKKSDIEAHLEEREIIK
ncbi:MAG: penicillin acylase family protein [Flavobacteriaceae bacterium]|nr:penicillin acylase family protein [Flavobacteriaceae bacterium]